MNLTVEIIHGHYLVSAPETGAVSLFSPAEYLAFNHILSLPDEEKRDSLQKFLYGYACGKDQTERFCDLFLRKLSQQGWLRTERKVIEPERLQMVYLSVTTHCNLSCSYCYIGYERRKPDHVMKAEDAIIILEKIKAFNPDARVAVTGGEPMTHPDIFIILDALEKLELKFSIGTNGVLVDDRCALRLKGYRNLLHVQASIDGISPEVHSLTRGDTLRETMNGIGNLIKHKVPFTLAPTIHEGNLHEIAGIARFSFRNGGLFTPNHLRRFPHAPHAQKISLHPDSLRSCIIETFDKINEEFDKQSLPARLSDETCKDIKDTRCKYVCGNGWHTIDLDWNGNVYPCHLLREKEFIIGNILEEEFQAIFDRSNERPTRTRSYEIPKCKKCPFVATCAGGCRASAFYNHGTFAAEDEFCEILYKFEVDKLFQSKDIPFHL